MSGNVIKVVSLLEMLSYPRGCGAPLLRLGQRAVECVTVLWERHHVALHSSGFEQMVVLHALTGRHALVLEADAQERGCRHAVNVSDGRLLVHPDQLVGGGNSRRREIVAS